MPTTDAATPAPALLEKAAAAHYLATTTRHLDRLVYERRIGHVKLGNKVRFRQRDLDAYIESHRVAPVP